MTKEVTYNGSRYMLTIDEDNNLFLEPINHIRGQYCLAYYCGNKKYKVEFKTEHKPPAKKSEHISWVNTMQEARDLVNTIDNSYKTILQ
jgi:hypothetical protein